jgi:hypothetical protein
MAEGRQRVGESSMSLNLMLRLQGFGHIALVLRWDDHGTAGLPRVVVPADADVAALDFGFAEGLHVLVPHRDADAARVGAVVDALLAAGAARVDAVNREALARGNGLDACWPRFEQEGRHGLPAAWRHGGVNAREAGEGRS